MSDDSANLKFGDLVEVTETLEYREDDLPPQRLHAGRTGRVVAFTPGYVYVEFCDRQEEERWWVPDGKLKRLENLR